MTLAAIFAALAITAADYPDADTVIVDDLTRTEYAADGTYVTVSEMKTKILTERGRRAESVQQLGYNARYGKASFDEVVVESEDGAKRAIDLRGAVGESTDNSSMSANIYDPLDRRLTCRIPGLKVGDTVTVKTTQRVTQSRVEGHFSDIACFESTAPVVHARYELKAPKDLPIARRELFRPAAGKHESRVETAADGSQLVVYEVSDVPQAFPEPAMPDLWSEVQHVVVSTVPDWPSLSKWYWGLCAPHLGHTNQAMTNKVGEIRAQLAPDAGCGALVDAIYRFVSQEVRYMGLTLEEKSPGYAPHDVDVTFDNRYGVCRDKAGLLVAMLRIAGVDAFPVLINVGPKMKRSVPQPFFNHAIVAVDLHGTGSAKYRLLDPTNENAKDPFPEYLSNLSYLVARPEGEELLTTPVPDPERNSLKVESKAKLGDDGSIVCTHEIAFNGMNDTVYRAAFARMRKDERRRFFEKQAKCFSRGAELIDFELTPEDVRDPSQPLQVKLVVKYPDMALEGERQTELQLPLISRVLSVVSMMLGDNASLEERKYDFLVDTTGSTSERFELELGDSVGEPIELPAAIDLRGGLEFRRTYEVKDGRLVSERREALTAMEFTPEEYLVLRERLREREVSDRRFATFACDRGRGADTKVLRRELDIDTAGAWQWSVTNLLETEILTYNGLKRNSELKLDFNPLVEDIEILSVTVSNRNGQVHALTGRERNELDAPWSAAAPRYPASRILVLTLPGVEVGSVIRAQYVRHVRSSPLPFYHVRYDDSFVPLGVSRVRIDDRQRELADLKPLRREEASADGVLWRRAEVVSKGDWREFAARLAPCIDCPTVEFAELAKATPEEIRNWMHKQIRIVGPGVFELPFDRHVTSPETVLAERYASGLDYVRTMVSLMRSAGYAADLVFIAADADEVRERRELDLRRHPRPAAFSIPACRLRMDGREYYVTTENEYTPFGASAFERCDVFDPKDASFALVTVPEELLSDCAFRSHRYLLRENGALDYRQRTEYRGVAAGLFRRKWEEMLPEYREREYLAILNAVAQGASATGPLVTETKEYPGVRDFECFVQDFASVRGDVMSMRLPLDTAGLPELGSALRASPVELPAFADSEEVFDVVFPAGYSEIEHVPEDFRICDPEENGRVIYESVTELHRGDDGGLNVTIRRISHFTPARILRPELAPLVTEWRRRLTNRAAVTISVRKPHL